MADYYTHYSLVVELPTEAAAEEAMKAFEEAFEVIMEGCDTPLLDDHPLANFTDTGTHASRDGKLLWLHDDEVGNPEFVAWFLGELIAKHDLPPIGFQWANTCSKPRLDAYSGGACVVTKDGAIWNSTEQWMAETLALANAGKTA